MRRLVLRACASRRCCSPGALGADAHRRRAAIDYFQRWLLTTAGTAKTGPALLTISLYDSQKDGTPLWSEQHAVTLDAQGRYAVILGTLTQGGISLDAFAAGSARWLGVAVDADAEQPRFMLLSVAYALKAADADTVGGETPTMRAHDKSYREGARRRQRSRSRKWSSSGEYRHLELGAEGKRGWRI